VIGKPVEVPDILDVQAPTAPQVQPILVRLGYRSLLAVPLLSEGRIMGGLVVWRPEAGRFSKEIVSLLETTMMRIGNEEYARTNQSFGLTTLRNHHASVSGPMHVRRRFEFGSILRFEFSFWPKGRALLNGL